MSHVPPQPPPPPAAVPPPPPPPPGVGQRPPGGSNRSVLVLVLVGLLVVGGGAFLLTSGGDDESGQGDPGTTTTVAGAQGGEDGSGDAEMAPVGGASPEEAVQGYIDAVVDADCAALVAHLTENMLVGMDRAMAVDECESTAGNQPEMAGIMSRLELRGTDEQDGVARIEGHADLDGSPLIIVFTLVRDGETWLVDNIA